MDGCYIVSQNVIIWGSVLNLKETKEIENQSTRRLKNFFLNFKCNFHQPATTVYVVFQFNFPWNLNFLFFFCEYDNVQMYGNEFETKEKLINFKPRIKLNHDINTLYNANLRLVAKGNYINFNLCLENRQYKCKPSLFLSPGTQEQFLVLEINIHLFTL